MTQQFTIAEVSELQNKRKQLEERLAVHTARAKDKEAELQQIFASVGVKDMTELSALCTQLNTQMQEYAQKEQSTIEKMRGLCDELDKLL